MRALVYHGPHDIRVEERPDPEPGPEEVLLRICATGICGSDLHGYTGENKRRHPGQIMGHETVGRIVALGSGVAGAELEAGAGGHGESGDRVRGLRAAARPGRSSCVLGAR